MADPWETPRTRSATPDLWEDATAFFGGIALGCLLWSIALEFWCGVATHSVILGAFIHALRRWDRRG